MERPCCASEGKLVFVAFGLSSLTDAELDILGSTVETGGRYQELFTLGY